jgi:NCS2 family nucleobase:cation symporter-2/xanthine permease XanP
VGDAVAVQRVSWRKDRATDFRAVQGAVAADGLGNFLSGLLATVPNTTYSSSVSIVEITGVAARRVGVCIGAGFVALAFLPKLVAVIVAIPGPVVAAYFMVLVASLFILGVRVLMHDGLDHRKGFAVGFAFWLGIAFQLDWIFPEYFQGQWSDLLGNSMTVGGLTVIALTLFDEVTGPRRQRLRVALSVDAYPKIDAFLSALGSRRRWSDEMTERVRAVGEETLLLLMRKDEGRSGADKRRLLLIAGGEGESALLEFIAATDETNLEDQLALLGERVAGAPVEEEISLRLLRHYASSVRHQQFHDTDVITVRVGPPASV